MSQPEYNNMGKIFTHTVDKGIPLLRLPKEAAQSAIEQARNLHGLVHCD
jgi:hypothetical protein